MPIFLALILLIGGVCSGLCFARMSGDTAAHSCCPHGKNHCGHAGPSIDGHAAVTMATVAPVVLSAPAMSQTPAVVGLESAPAPQYLQFSPPLRSSVLRI
jgi:hypothetical protein